MPRSSMAALISQTRTLIADRGTLTTFSDDDIQAALDRRRIEHRWQHLAPAPTFVPGGAVSYLDFYSDTGACAWEDDYTLQDISYADVTASADLAEPIVGHWHFPASPNGFAVRITGKTYDLYGSAADLLESWAATAKLDFDFTNGSDQYRRSQKSQMLRDLAADYRKRALPQTSRATQSDAVPANIGPAVVYPTYGSEFDY